MNIWQAIQQLDRLVFTSREIASLTGVSLSAVSQTLGRLEQKRLIQKIKRGIWALTHDKRFSPYLLVPFLEPSHLCYVSFISALHIYGIIGQIPQTITLATTAHSKKIVTPVGVFRLHQIAPSFFKGFDWHEGRTFLIAASEKALVDCLYLAARKGKNYAAFPELDFPSSFSKAKAREWAGEIQDPKIRKAVGKQLSVLL
ncbi:MAG: replication/maintenance protein RepL [Deltaproteobacteria bacterium]|nr:replication/maintenance protein RepL [Deltaproteobacteria bacterium]